MSFSSPLIRSADLAPDGLPVTNPADDTLLARVRTSAPEDVTRAVAAAEEAQRGWQARTAWERAAVLRRFNDLMLAHQAELARILTLEQGKPLAEAAGEIAYAASFLDWSAEEARRVYGETIPAKRPNQRIIVMRQPVGVTAAITPWNFPSAMITRKLGPALAAGCAMVVKPAEQTPLSALALLGLATEAGVPEGLFSVVVGDPGPIGDVFFDDTRVRVVSFTGSTAVGKLLMAKAARTVTRLGLELGGHAPFIVFDDADLDAAVKGAVASKFRNAGQTCICANRFLVQDGIYDRFSQALAEATSALRVGRGMDEGVHIGPLIDDGAASKVQRHIQDAVARGATLRMGTDSASAPVDGLAQRFFAPVIVEGVTGDMLVSQEETFGPVVPLRRFHTEAEAIALANDTEYGLAAYFYTRDVSRVMRVAEALQYGIVGANDGGPSTAQAPFGGMKQSGIGREGGHYALDEYLEIKYVSLGI